MGYDGSWAAMMAIWGAFAFLFIVIALVLYVLKSIGLSTLAARRGIENPWLAWIPIADLYIMGLLVGEMDIFNYHLDNLGLWFPVIVVGGYILSRLHGIGFIFGLALLVFMILFVYKLFGIYTTQAALYSVLSILLGLLGVFLFIIRNNEPLNQAASGPSVPPPDANV